jgi:hypothetical protein
VPARLIVVHRDIDSDRMEAENLRACYDFFCLEIARRNFHSIPLFVLAALNRVHDAQLTDTIVDGTFYLVLKS